MHVVTGWLIIDIVLFSLAIVLPGLALARVGLEDSDPLVVGAIGVTIGVFGMPLLGFVTAVALRTHISGGLLLAQAAVVVGLAYAWQRRRGAQID